MVDTKALQKPHFSHLNRYQALKKERLRIEMISNFTLMQIERVNNEILIRLSANTDTIGLQRLLDFLRVKEIVSKSTATEKQIENISAESKSDWWSKNKDRFLK